MASFTCPHCDKAFTSFTDEPSPVIVCPHCNGMVSLPDDDLNPGTTLGGFEIVRLLGKGGMGHVYLARQASMNRFVALKVLARDLTRDRQAVAQFFRETQLSGKLSHPNIVAAIDAGEDQDRYYLAMNYVDGEDLEEEMRRFGAIREEEGLRVAARMADALRYAWEHYGLLHKDIKPGNIMRDRSGEVFLMDMGIAQLVNDRARRDDQVVGSPFYMSPEQGRGDQLDWRSDCYSLGASLYHMMVGKPPFDDEDVMRIIAMHNTDPFPEPAKRSDVKLLPTTVALLRRMMAKSADERFSSWQAALITINEALAAAEKAANASPSRRRSSPASAGGKAKSRGHASRRVKTVDGSKPTAQTPVSRSADSKAALITYGLMIVVAIVISLMIVQYRKNRSMENSLAQAEQFLAQNPGDLATAVQRFAEVNRIVAGTSLAGKVAERYRQVQMDLEAYNRELVVFESEMQRAKNLCTQKQYEDAIPIVQTARNKIRDPLKKKEADMLLVMIQKTIEDRDAGKP